MKEEVVKTLNLFLAYQTFRERWVATRARRSSSRARRERARRTWRRPWPKRPACPYLFVSSTAFQSMYYGQTGRKIRNYFKALRKAAREEGGAIGFIEEIDAIAGARSGMRRSVPRSERSRRSGVDGDRAERRQRGVSGVVNELLIQLQSFDQPTSGNASVASSSTWRTVGSRSAADSEAAAARVEHLVDRGDEPRRRPRPRDAPPGPLRPVDPLRPAEPLAAGARSSTSTSTARRTCPSSTRKSAATSSPR